MNKLKTENLYKKDKSGKLRVYFIEYDIDDYCYTINTGVFCGKIVSTKPYYVTPKNVGKVNETSYYSQLLSEVNSLYEIAIKDGYSKIIDTDYKFSVMLAFDYSKIKNINFSDYLIQPKLDGIRSYNFENTLYSRTNREIKYSQSHITDSLSEFYKKYPKIILDGELYSHDLKDSFNTIVSSVRKEKPSDFKMDYYLYDMYNPENPKMAYEDRLLFLETELCSYNFIKIVETNPIYSKADFDFFNSKNLSDGYEGSILRKANSPYEFGRSKNLLKCKIFNDEEFEIIDIEEGTGNWSGFAKSLTVKIDENTICKSNIKGNELEMKDLIENKDFYIGTLVTIKFFGKTEDGKLRFPVATKFHCSRNRVL